MPKYILFYIACGCGRPVTSVGVWISLEKIIYFWYPLQWGFAGGSDHEESTCNAGDLDSIPGSGGSLGGGHGSPLQYSCLENPHGQRSLVGYSPWCCKESDTAEPLSAAQHSRPFSGAGCLFWCSVNLMVDLID